MSNQNKKYSHFSLNVKLGDLAEFATMLGEHTSTLVGQSGVGKSALAKTVLPFDDIHIAADEDDDTQANETSRLGRHTTTTARLYHLEDQQGDIIDSPGVRIMHMQGLSRLDITAGFQEIAQTAAHCQFRDCRHQHEAKCAVLAAVAAGEISTRRWQSYQALCDEVQTK